MSIKVIFKYDVFDGYKKAGSQCRSTGMTPVCCANCPLSNIIKLEWLKRYRNFPDDLSYVTQNWNTSVSMSDSSN
ncbi:hypothetical protein, partial [Wolbachia endosymbiont of Mansonella perstans]|uniref:hypothetical protein n=1 Tax=Wolbachia endosymbiont of Mansonella perstans TaxID=229526 RepID=UPI001CE0481B